MRIGFNLLFLLPGTSGGTETYARNLIAELIPLREEHELILFASAQTSATFFHLVPGVTIVEVGNFSLGKLHRIFFEQFIFPFIVWKHRVDVMLSPGYVIPVLAPCRHVVAVHDMLYKRHPASMPKWRLLYWSVFVYLSVRRSAAVVAISQFGRDELVHFFPFSAKKVSVTLLSADREFFSSGNPLTRPAAPYLLSVATLSPHKNFEILLRALALIKKTRGIAITLNLVGNKERSTESIETLIDQLGLGIQVHLLGFVTQEQLRELYANAAMFIFPSFNEGFGLPILEAMSSGCPVVCSGVGPMRQVGGDAAMYFDPFDVQQIADTIVTVWEDSSLRDGMREKGLANLERFSWKETARLTKALLV